MIANEKNILMPSTKPITLFINGKKVLKIMLLLQSKEWH